MTQARLKIDSKYPLIAENLPKGRKISKIFTKITAKDTFLCKKHGIAGKQYESITDLHKSITNLIEKLKPADIQQRIRFYNLIQHARTNKNLYDVWKFCHYGSDSGFKKLLDKYFGGIQYTTLLIIYEHAACNNAIYNNASFAYEMEKVRHSLDEFCNVVLATSSYGQHPFVESNQISIPKPNNNNTQAPPFSIEQENEPPVPLELRYDNEAVVDIQDDSNNIEEQAVVKKKRQRPETVDESEKIKERKRPKLKKDSDDAVDAIVLESLPTYHSTTGQGIFRKNTVNNINEKHNIETPKKKW